MSTRNKRNAAKSKTTASSARAVSEPPAKADPVDSEGGALGSLILIVLLLVSFYLSYTFRLYAVMIYGRIIHEFDPWFNFRATEYMVEHGVYEFFNWFDEMSWYPIGRHIGSTTFPGLQLTATAIFRFFDFIGFPISINDICVFIPAVFGVITTFFTYLLTKEISRSSGAGVIAALVMSILPAHLMRSIAGGYDNECIALAAITATFYFWVRCLRKDSPNAWLFAPLCGLSYVYMVAAWGGYTFVLNMIGLHAGLLLFLGRYSTNLFRAYLIFYVIGTFGAVQFPVVGWLPLKSLEQLMPMLVFFALIAYRITEYFRQKMDMRDFANFQMRMLSFFGLIGSLVFGYLFFTDFFGPFSNRIRSLFIPHTHTGNPLVDSVSEHQATAASYYWQYFHIIFYIFPFGFLLLFKDVSDTKIFGILYCVWAYYFSQKMVRLILLLSTPAAMTSGMILHEVIRWSLVQFRPQEEEEDKPAVTSKKQHPREKDLLAMPPMLRKLFPLLAIAILVGTGMGAYNYYYHCDMLAQQMSHPQVLLLGRDENGNPMIIDDFMQAYWWLRDYTPADARIMAWWDYGYQINGVANRTTIADGNTWNHEHIALLGKALVSPEKKAWRIARHLADYVLVWTTRFVGMYGDDLAKMPHIGNIAGSVYADVPRTGYYMDEDGEPSPLMRESLLYKLSVHNLVPHSPPITYFKEAYTSPNKMVRIYKVLNVAPRHPFGTYSPKLELGQFEG